MDQQLSSSMQTQDSQASNLLGGTIDSKRFRSVMGAFATGVAIITTEWNGEMFGATVNSLTSVSLQPCLLLFCVSDRSTTGLAIRNRRLFSVNILGQHQADLSARFTGTGKDRFSDLALDFSTDGLPLLIGAAAQLCCRVAAIHKAGDHDIVLGEVISGDEMACDPLVSRALIRWAIDGWLAYQEKRDTNSEVIIRRQPSNRLSQCRSQSTMLPSGCSI